MSPPDLPRYFAGTVRAFLKRDHARIAGLHDQLLEEVAAQRANADSPIWRRFEAAVRDHMQVEEQYLLRPFTEVHPEEGAALHREHVQLQGALDKARTELNAPALFEFMTAFVAHAQREDPLLYVWAEQVVERTTQVAITRELADRERQAAFRP